MSFKLKYHQALSEVVLHALLHILMQKAQSTRFIPPKRSNDILVKYLKAQISRSKYSVCKKDIKTMLAIARKGGNLLVRLFEIHQMNLDYRAKFSQADELYILFNNLCEQNGYSSRLAPDGQQADDVSDETIYMTQKEIETGFDDDNRQVKALVFWVKTPEPQRVVECVSVTSPYVATIKHTDEEGITHFLLTREDIEGSSPVSLAF
ncbi:DUF2913 family protein [Vibrio pectenicida]|uniref:DUF2913 family protein n=1 Tax=Vibrio pectenicida TaxID=62763 RepID=A0A3R9FKV6_9VIBR|nr:DUF2913 family protein [Vibrio pectenicida]RSD30399.1 DUF2913 family protein [Vibrio pectenicida]